MKTIKIEKLEAGVNEMKSANIGHRFTIIRRIDAEGIEHRTEYEKVNEREVKIIRHYEYS